jgi:hypothetical protein
MAIPVAKVFEDTLVAKVQMAQMDIPAVGDNRVIREWVPLHMVAPDNSRSTALLEQH